MTNDMVDDIIETIFRNLEEIRRLKIELQKIKRDCEIQEAEQ